MAERIPKTPLMVKNFAVIIIKQDNSIPMIERIFRNNSKVKMDFTNVKNLGGTSSSSSVFESIIFEFKQF